MNNNIHPPFQPIINMLKPIDTSGLDQSRASLKKMIREMEPEKDFTQLIVEKRKILLDGLLEIHKRFMLNRDWEGAQKVDDIITKSITHV